MIRRIVGALADGFLKFQNTAIPMTSWMPRFYRVKKLIDWQAKQTLDASCGTGELTVWMAKRGLSISGTNISQHEIDFAQALSNKSKLDIEFRVGDLSAQTPYESASFDQVVSLDTVAHIPDDTAALHELHRLLKPKGRLLISIASVSPSGRGGLFAGEDFFRKHTPRFLHAPAGTEDKNWFQLTIPEQKAWARQQHFYTLEGFEKQISELFNIVHYEYAIHRFTTWATDLIFGVRLFRFFCPILYVFCTRLDRIFYGTKRKGYLLFAILEKK